MPDLNFNYIWKHKNEKRFYKLAIFLSVLVAYEKSYQTHYTCSVMILQLAVSLDRASIKCTQIIIKGNALY